MIHDVISRDALRNELTALEKRLPGFWIDGPYAPTSKGSVSNWQAMAYPKGEADIVAMRLAKDLIDELKVRQPTVRW
jgi:hypothetical protein